MKNIKLDYLYTDNFISQQEIISYEQQIKTIHNNLHNSTGEGNEYLGWLTLPEDYDKKEFEKIKETAQIIQNNSDILIVIGIGGSYLGAKMVIEALNNNFYNYSKTNKSNKPQIIFAGNTLSSTYLSDLIEYIKDKDFSINVISKSGTTIEPAISFRILKEILIEKYGKEESKNRIFITTDKEKGNLKKFADKEGYQTFNIPDNIGGRYSILTSVGLLPIAAAGYNINELINGAKDAMIEYNNSNLLENECYQYAIIRNILYKKGKLIELLVNYEPNMNYFSEWWKQLFGESEGKEHKGIFPAAVNFTTDLHSMGQYIQEGQRIIFETTLFFEKPNKDILIPSDKDNVDNLNFLINKNLSYVNEQAFKGTVLAHTKGEVPNLIINVEKMNEYNLGQLIYFFEKACAISGYLNNINPFNQPGVEVYKKNMYELLGKAKK